MCVCSLDVCETTTVLVKEWRTKDARMGGGWCWDGEMQFRKLEEGSLRVHQSKMTFENLNL